MSNDTFELRRLDLQVNTNYHVAATLDGTVAKLYLDGTLVDSGSFASFAGSGTSAGGIGCDPFIPADSYFHGNIDEVRISDVALPPSQFEVPEPGRSALAIFVAAATLLPHRKR